MEFWKSIGGMLDVELTSAEPEVALAAVNAAGVVILQIRQVSDLTWCFRIHRKDYPKLEALSTKRGETLRIVRKSGIFWAGRALKARPVLLVGIILLLGLILYFPSRVFFVRVEGNSIVPSQRILAAAEDCGICFGASRREVRSEKIKNALLSAVPELQWAGVNTSGCVATISVRERTDSKISNAETEVSSIVAARDGYILSGTVTSGNALFQIGQTVKEGQVLISGYTDCGICIRATKSGGEILAQTKRSVEAVTPSQCLRRDEIREIRRKYSFLLRKKRINLWKDSRISDASCGRMYEEYYVTLPGGFQLPIALCVETYVFYETQDADVSQSDAEDALNKFADRYLRRQMVAGEIQDKAEHISLGEGIYSLNGEYICVEMIGREQQEQIGDTNGKSG